MRHQFAWPMRWLAERVPDRKAFRAQRAGKPGCHRALGELAPIASGANSVASALGNPARRDPGEAVRTYHVGFLQTRQLGTFLLGWP
jgi:hypothetical protein